MRRARRDSLSTCHSVHDTPNRCPARILPQVRNNNAVADILQRLMHMYTIREHRYSVLWEQDALTHLWESDTEMRHHIGIVRPRRRMQSFVKLSEHHRGDFLVHFTAIPMRNFTNRRYVDKVLRCASEPACKPEALEPSRSQART